MARWFAALVVCSLVLSVSSQQGFSKFRRGQPEKPRPFEPATYLPPTGYPPAGKRPIPSYNEGPATRPPNQQVGRMDEETPYPPGSSTYQPDQSSSYSPGQPSYTPSEPSYSPSQPSQPDQPSYTPSQPPYSPSQPETQPDQPPYQPTQTDEPAQQNTPLYEQPKPNEGQTGSSEAVTPDFPDSEDSPAHVHAISVDCGREMMTINIEFNKPYDGLIYSQGHYNEDNCVYVRENSNQVKYSFTVSLNTCGTTFFSDFENEGQAYLENVLVLQNEVSIQEAWDHIRRVRCLWEGSVTKQLVSSLSVGMLNQITSNFSGDTAMARLDIQQGRGPFAPQANGLVKIGETLTLVVSIMGDAAFDVLVRECVARDADGKKVVPLTDTNGCSLKPKLFGAFQKTRDTGNTGASILAYAFFSAFKFPDEMDLNIQCEIELCKTDCEVCPNPGKLEPGKRRRRDVIHVGNRTIEPSTTISKNLKVVFEEDLPQQTTGFCVSPNAALWGSVLVLLGSLLSSVMVSLCFIKSKESGKFA